MLQNKKSEKNLENQEDARGALQFTTLKQGKSPYKRSCDEGESHPQTKKKKIDLIFKDVLEASLESSKFEETQLATSTPLSLRRASKYQAEDIFEQCGSAMQHSSLSLSRNQSEREWKAPHSSSFISAKEMSILDDDEEEPLSLKADSPTELSLASAQGNSHEIPTTSFCPNCIRLKKKIRELQAELDMLRSGKLPEPPVLPPQVPELQEFSDPTGKPCQVRAFSKPCLRRVVRCLCAVYPSKAFCFECSGEPVVPWKVLCQVLWLGGPGADAVGTVENTGKDSVWQFVAIVIDNALPIKKTFHCRQFVCCIFDAFSFSGSPSTMPHMLPRKYEWLCGNAEMCSLCVWNYVLLCPLLEISLCFLHCLNHNHVSLSEDTFPFLQEHAVKQPGAFSKKNIWVTQCIVQVVRM